MKTIKVVLNEPENGVDTFMIGNVFKYGEIYKFERFQFKDIPVAAELRIECLDESVWVFDFDKIQSWEVIS
ncbi:hypothetical protein [Anaerococcus sp. Marseille-Q5996]|uniref:hypothetical protein n=1 Tax=Anaerococcus sp. Marseille-Q5996 TaxID=2972769 RepID=UPI0021C5833E|nr:hypothetical protein [Anaerococcus sp. Marseille-Q5996]